LQWLGFAWQQAGGYRTEARAQAWFSETTQQEFGGDASLTCLSIVEGAEI
jgi:hypothetical protein